MYKAVIFDVDGTLMDSVDLHVRAWEAAFREHQVRVSYATINRLIGETGRDLASHVLSGEEYRDHGPRLVERANAIFRKEFSARVRPFHGATALVQALHERGFRIALASNAPHDELVDIARRLGIRDRVAVIVSAADVDAGKPSGDEFREALRRLGVPARHAVVIGDTPDDIMAARHAGLPAIAVDSGGFGPDALRAAGAIAVYRSLLELVDELETSALVGRDDAPGVASSTPSPGPNL